MSSFFKLAKFGCADLIRHVCGSLSLYCPFISSTYPHAVDIYPTFRCNLNCKQCFNFKRGYFKEISTSDWIAVLKKLRAWLGPFHLRISGGEPFTRQDLLEIIQYANSQGIFTIVATNGTLINKENAKRIIESGLNSMAISLDGLKETHNFLRGKNVYEKIEQAIYLLKNNIKITIFTTIMRCNLDEIIGIVDFCEKNNLKISFSGLELIDTNKCFQPVDTKKIENFFKVLFEKKTKSKSMKDSLSYLYVLKSCYLRDRSMSRKSCSAPQRHLKIIPDGTVKICKNRYPSLGNIVREDPKIIWNSKKTLQIKKMMKYCIENCEHTRCYNYDTLFERIVKFSKDILLPSIYKQ